MVLLGTGIALAQPSNVLRADGSYERTLAGGQTDTYRVALDAGEFFDAVVEQRGIDVEVALLGPDGRQIAHMDSLNNDLGPEPLTAIAGVQGEYTLRISAGNPKVAPGAYKVTVLALRPATAEDKEHVAADRGVDEAMDLLSQGKALSLAAAAHKLTSAAAFTMPRVCAMTRQWRFSASVWRARRAVIFQPRCWWMSKHGCCFMRCRPALWKAAR